MDYLSLVGKKFNDWNVIEWLHQENSLFGNGNIDKYIIRCKCGNEICMRWQSFTRNVKCCRICKKKSKSS